MTTPLSSDPVTARVGSGKAQYPTPPSLLDASHYTDPDQYQRELTSIFHQVWMPVCPASDLLEARDYVVWDGVGQSVVIARLDDGGLVAWHNVCQHRGARLVEESGRCPLASFKCPWHGCAYDLEGRVQHVPLREAFDESELQGLRAPQVRVEEWNGFVWLTFHDGTALIDYLGELGDDLGGYHLEDWEWRYRDSWTIQANWKTVIDAFNETWHVPFTHKNSVRGGLLWRDAAIKLMEPHSMMAIPVRKYLDQMAEGEDHRRHMLCHYLAFPNTIFNCFPTHVQAFSAWPLGPRETRLVAFGIVNRTPEGWTDEDWHARTDRDWEHFKGVVAEDEGVLRNAGRVYDSLGFKRQMFNAAEGRLTSFHEQVNLRAEA
jgi:choline monooxygenase